MKNISTIKNHLENDKKFQYWNKVIGLTFDDFSIYNLISDTKALIVKKGLERIGKYSIYLKNGAADCFCFDMDNETVRKHNLKKIKSLL